MTNNNFFAPDTFDIFIAHCWSYDDEWNSFVRLLDEILSTSWRNWSLPWHDPSINHVSEKGRAQVIKLLRGQISQSKVIFVLGDLLDESKRQKDWLLLQIDLAEEMGKRLIGVHRRDRQYFPADLAPRMEKLILFDKAAVAQVLK